MADHWTKADHDAYADRAEEALDALKGDLRREIQLMISSSENRLRLTIFGAVFANVLLNQLDPLKAAAAAGVGALLALVLKLLVFIR